MHCQLLSVAFQFRAAALQLQQRHMLYRAMGSTWHRRSVAPAAGASASMPLRPANAPHSCCQLLIVSKLVVDVHCM